MISPVPLVAPSVVQKLQPGPPLVTSVPLETVSTMPVHPPPFGLFASESVKHPIVTELAAPAVLMNLSKFLSPGPGSGPVAGAGPAGAGGPGGPPEDPAAGLDPGGGTP